MMIKKLLQILTLIITLIQPAFAQDTDDAAANYKAALALNNEGKGLEGVALLEKVIKTQSNYTNAAYNLLGSIYDKNNQPDKAITVFNEGLKAYPKDQTLYFNLGIAYFRAKKYADAELAAIEAIKLDPKHANSQRLYGLVTFHQNKRMNALMAFCSYLLLEPNGARSDEAITNLQSILKGGVLRSAGANKNIGADAREIGALNAIINQTIATGKTNNLSGGALLEYQLKNIFLQAGKTTEKKQVKTFFDQFFATFFYKLAQSGNVSAMVKLINEKTLDTSLQNWVASTERTF